MSVETMLGLMISFGSLIATLIFGILTLAYKNDKKVATVTLAGDRFTSFLI